MKTLHRVFACSSVLLLVATAWMFWVDHQRGWKTIQRRASGVEARLTEWRRLEYEHTAAQQQEEQLGKQLEQASRRQRSTFFVFHGWLPLPGKRWLELPILDAFNSPRKIETLWSEDLEIDYNFRKIRRFDRCTTCHQLIDKVIPGLPGHGAVPPAQPLELVLIPPLTADVADLEESSPDDQAVHFWGVKLGPENALGERAVTVQFVVANSPAARALPRHHVLPETAEGKQLRLALLQPGGASNLQRGLMPGDQIVAIDGQSVGTVEQALQQLAAARQNDRAVLSITRGITHPYASHPRLDLFVGSLSPHPMTRFGCTICHEGQGNATEFRWSSHTPNNAAQRRDWRRAYGWFDNPHWDYPMFPRRFAESSCLRCHHDVTELGASGTYPDAPAPQLVEGYRLILDLGCYGCHEINGFNESRRVGPDLRLEFNTTEIAAQLMATPGFGDLSDDQRTAVQQLYEQPDDKTLRRRVAAILDHDARAATPALPGTSNTHLAQLLANGNGGRLRKRGPSLRHVAEKMSRRDLAEWIWAPRAKRPQTRMPHSFGNWQHLDPASRQLAEQWEPVEVQGIAAYLEDNSQPVQAASPRPAGLVDEPSTGQIARGRRLFQEQGCLACHQHNAFADAEPFRDPELAPAGPDLSSLKMKISDERGRRWLYDWIKNPAAFNPRTTMPQIAIEPLPSDGEADTDPIADLVAFLLDGGQAPTQTPVLDERRMTGERLRAVTEAYLATVVTPDLAAQLARTGIPAAQRDLYGPAEQELVVEAGGGDGSRLSPQQQLRYVGRKAIARYGCYGCHDIPGFETARPIGVNLTDWGKKLENQLGFENVADYLQRVHGVQTPDEESDESFYWDQIRAGHRAGFAFQKLREPRSFDYALNQEKRYTDWLRMPQFDLDNRQREAIVTFLLGLVADAPREAYVYRPDPDRAALWDGLRVVRQYRCGSCHMLAPERWTLGVEPGTLAPQPPLETFPFLKPAIDMGEQEASTRGDHTGLARGEITGMPVLDDGGLPIVFDEDGFPLADGDEYESAWLEFVFDLWSPAVLDGQPYQVGVMPLSIFADWIEKRRAADGGFLARYLLPHVVSRQKEINAAAKGSEAWGWLPPPLFGEGRKVQSDWLYQYLKSPYPIRPASLMRMPKFQFAPDEVTALARYFAVRDGVDYPHSFAARQDPQYLEQREAEYQEHRAAAESEAEVPATRLEAAMAIVTDGNYCIKCHQVADFRPDTDPRTAGPDLAQVRDRLRPDLIRRWIASPKSVLPYTGMPVNVPYESDSPTHGGVSQDLYPGTSEQQLDGLVDLLLNFDLYLQTNQKIAPIVKSPTTESAEPPQGDDAGR